MRKTGKTGGKKKNTGEHTLSRPEAELWNCIFFGESARSFYCMMGKLHARKRPTVCEITNQKRAISRVEVELLENISPEKEVVP